MRNQQKWAIAGNEQQNLGFESESAFSTPTRAHKRSWSRKTSIKEANFHRVKTNVFGQKFGKPKNLGETGHPAQKIRHRSV